MSFFEKILTDFFDDQKITPQRIYLCAQYTLNQLILFNSDSVFDDLITELTAVIDTLEAELSNMDTGIITQKNTTKSNNDVMASFKITMGQKKGAIADKLGGFDTNAFRMFYPNSKSDYPGANKEDMNLLTKRVYSAAVANATALGAALATLLKSFQGDWKTSRNIQESQIGEVDDTRTSRTPAVIAVNNKLKKVLGFLWGIYEGNDKQTAVFFNFKSLFNITKYKNENFSGDLGFTDTDKTKLLANDTFVKGQIIKGRNNSANATFIIYIVHIASDTATLLATVGAGKTFKVEAQSIGDLENTMLVIQNTSTVNPCSYQVTYKQNKAE